MQLATTSHTPDKSNWPTVQPLPTTLPAPAAAAAPTHPVTPFRIAGSLAATHASAADRLSPQVDAARLLGRDPRAALAAATALAGQQLLVPVGGLQKQYAQTLIGLYETAPGGTLYAAPLWTATWAYYDRPAPMQLDRVASPDARFRFDDQRLLAVVGANGFVANPAAADRFRG
jgi:hypothetical protein